MLQLAVLVTGACLLPGSPMLINATYMGTATKHKHSTMANQRPNPFINVALAARMPSISELQRGRVAPRPTLQWPYVGPCR